MRLKFLNLVAAGCLLSAAPAMILPAAASPSTAGLSSAVLRLDTAWRQPAYTNPYENPDRSYPSYTDFSRELNGVPCGIECTQAAEHRDAGYYALAPRHYRIRHYRTR
ncbi:MAG: hypothetical protein ACYC5H_16315 [Methylovirgula sp.]